LALLNIKRYGAVVISFSCAAQYAFDSAYAWYLYGATLEETGNLQKALDSFTKALELEENVFFLTDRGRVLRQLGQYDAAMASYDLALKLYPNYQDIWLNRGALLCDYLNRPQEALT
jgi:tetratricopeptide (TPR) repeat protein